MDTLTSIRTMAEEMLTLEDRIKKGEELLKELKKQHRDISENALPEAMESAGMEEFTMTDGRVIGLELKTHAHISADNADAAFDWLREHDHSDIIKRTLTIEFPRDSEKHSRHLFRYLSARKYLQDAAIKSDEKVHPSTLKAFVRQALEDGEDIPQETFGIHQVLIARAASKTVSRKKS